MIVDVWYTLSDLLAIIVSSFPMFNTRIYVKVLNLIRVDRHIVIVPTSHMCPFCTIQE